MVTGFSPLLIETHGGVYELISQLTRTVTVAINFVTSFSHTHYLWPCHFVVYVVRGDLSRDMACVFKTGKITVYCFC